MSDKSDDLKKRMLDALKLSAGRVSDAAEIIGIARQTHYKWMDADPEYKQAVADVDESMIDWVESKLFQLIDGPTREVMTEEGIQQMKDAPTPSAVIFYLKTKGKKRGYVERQEISGPDEGPVQIIIPASI
jgi:hypothetical protein